MSSHLRRSILSLALLGATHSAYGAGLESAQTSVFEKTQRAQSGREVIGEMRGYVAINRALRERLIEPSASFEIGTYIGDKFAPWGTSLVDLLGVYKSGAAGARFRNGVPNAVNMLLWHTLFAGVAGDVANVCTIGSGVGSGSALALRDDFKLKAMALCEWPLGTSRSDATLMTYWLAVMGYDAPLTEFYAWKTFVQDRELDELDGRQAVEWLTSSILNNPYFLLRP